MKIVTLSEEQFTEFANNHKYRNYHQTVNYAKLMVTEGYNYNLLGFINNSNEIIGATMILFKTIFFGYKMAYAPFGFLIDYSDSDLIEELTKKIKKLLLKQRFIYLKINPKIHCSERDKNGKIISYNPEVNDILEILQKNEYIHHGFNNFFENEKPRWTAVVKLTASNSNLYKNLSKQTRNKISKAIRSGVEISEGNNDDIDILYEFIKRKHNHTLKYYQKLLDEFNGKAKIYFAKINTEKYLIQIKAAYEHELLINSEHNEQLQQLSRYGKDLTNIINKKMESDKKLSNYQLNLIQATNLYSTNPNGIIIGGALIIEYMNGTNLVIEGFNKKYNAFNPNYLLKWELIKKFNEEEFNYFNLNGIVGEFKEKNKYSGLNEMKLGYNASAIEYIGEFDLIINQTVYNIYKSQQKKHKI